MPDLRYPTMEFPSYVYQEYPKWVPGANGEKVLVNNQSEELNAAVVVSASTAPDPVAQERDALAQQTADLQAQLVTRR